jgi:enoyl-CoA hydratase
MPSPQAEGVVMQAVARFTEIEYLAEGEIRILRLNRPEVRNCIGPVTSREMIEAWSLFRDDDSAKVCILTGAGDKAFCSGADLKAAEGLLPLSESERAAHRRGERPGVIGPSRWTDIYKPILAAVNGVAYAGGLEWACFADIRIAEEHATFGVTCRRWNIGLTDGGTVRLPLIVGLGRAMDLIITGRVIDAREAERMGLVNEVVPSGQSLARALELARFICTLPQPAIRTDKESVLRTTGRALEEAMAIEATCFDKLLEGPEIRAGLSQFRSRSHPDLRRDAEPVTPGLPRSK